RLGPRDGAPLAARGVEAQIGLDQGLNTEDESMSLETMVDLDRYPVHELASERGQRLVAECRLSLAREGVMMLPGFLKPEATACMAREAEAIREQAYFKEVVGNPYLEPVDASLPVDHPRRMTESTVVGALAYDQIPEAHALRRLYEWETMLEF